MTDLTKITTPFGLLDEETQDALMAHGGPYEVFCDNGTWSKHDSPVWFGGITYRVKPLPPKPREWWVLCLPGELPELWGHYPDLGKHPDFFGEIVHVREVLE